MKLSAIDLNLLLALDALLDGHSVTRAAKQMGVTPSAMSHTLKRLQEQLEDPLLIRAGKTMVATRRASELAPQVKRAIAEVSRVFSAPPDLDPSRLEEVFRIAASDQITTLFGQALDHLLARDAPGVDLYFQPPREDVVAGFRSGELDLAIGVFPRLSPDMYVQRLYRERFATVVRVGHPEVRDRPTLAQYLALPHILVAPRGTRGGRVDLALAERSLSRRVARIEQSFLAALYRASRSDYLLTVPSRLAHRFCDVFGLRAYEPPIEIPSYGVSQVWHSRDHDDPRHRWLRQIIMEAIREAIRTLEPLAGDAAGASVD